MIERRVTYGSGHAATPLIYAEPIAKTRAAELPMDVLLTIAPAKTWIDRGDVLLEQFITDTSS